MGAIQGSINNMLTQAGIAARLSPELENRAELRKITKQEQALQKLVSNIEEVGFEDYDEGLKKAIQYSEELEKTQEKKALLSGKAKDIDPIFKTRDEIQGLKEENPAQLKALEKMKQKREQEERFKKFADIFTEGGKYQ